MDRPEVDPRPALPRRPSPRGGYQGSRPSGPITPPDTPAADVPATDRQLPEVRYQSLRFAMPGSRDQAIHMVMCLRCGAVVVAMETARHDLSHLAAEGHIAPGTWALIDRPVAL